MQNENELTRVDDERAWSRTATGFPRAVAHTQQLGESGRFLLAMRRFRATKLARVVAIEGVLTPSELQSALRSLQLRHPLMRVRIVEQREPYFEHGVSNTLRVHVVARESEQHWQRVLESALDTPGSRLPSSLFELHYVYSERAARGELIFVADHAVADGVSMNHLCSELLALCRPGATLEPRPVLPTLEQLLPVYTRRRQLTSFGLALLRLGRVALSRSLHETRTAPSGSRYTYRELTEHETTQLVTRTRAEHTTVTGALLAATLLAVQEQRAAPGQLAITVPVDLRTRIPGQVVSAADLGHYTSVVYLTSRARKSLWPLARSLKAQLERTVESRHLLAAVPLVYRVGRRLLRKNSPALAHAMLSNSGIVPFATDYGSFRPVGFFSATSAAMLSADFAFFCNTLHGRLCLNLVFSEQVLSRAEAELALERVVRTLTQL